MPGLEDLRVVLDARNLLPRAEHPAGVRLAVKGTHISAVVTLAWAQRAVPEGGLLGELARRVRAVEQPRVRLRGRAADRDAF